MRLSLAFLFFLNWIVAFPSDSSEASKLIRKFENTYRPARTLQSTFLETYIDNGRIARSEAGVAYFGKPGKMRWEYHSPEPNVFVVDGKWSWFYVPADHTVSRMRAKESSDWRTPLALLAGEMKVSRICKSVEIDTSTPATNSNGAVLRCRLRADEEGNTAAGSSLSAGGEQTVLFELIRDTGELVRIVVLDPGGVQLEFRFANWQFDPHLEAARFRFEVPKGVAIVDGDLSVRTSDAGLAKAH